MQTLRPAERFVYEYGSNRLSFIGRDDCIMAIGFRQIHVHAGSIVDGGNRLTLACTIQCNGAARTVDSREPSCIVFMDDSNVHITIYRYDISIAETTAEFFCLPFFNGDSIGNDSGTFHNSILRFLVPTFETNAHILILVVCTSIVMLLAVLDHIIESLIIAFSITSPFVFIGITEIHFSIAHFRKVNVEHGSSGIV